MVQRETVYKSSIHPHLHILIRVVGGLEPIAAVIVIGGEHPGQVANLLPVQLPGRFQFVCSGQTEKDKKTWWWKEEAQGSI